MRTKLQALIAAELIDRGEITVPFVLMKIFQHRADEDDESVYAQYRVLEAQAHAVWTDITGAGFMRSFWLALLAATVSALSGGYIFNANICSYPVALALRLTPWSRLKSFDDGFANIEPGHSPYVLQAALQGNTWKHRLLRTLLPQGAAYFARNTALVHFSIYRGRANVVPADRLRFIELNWEELLTDADRKKLEKPVAALLVGTKYDEFPPHLGIANIAAGLHHKIDLYLPHPRERKIAHPDKMVRLQAPAESAIRFLARRNPLRVYHFDSSVAHMPGAPPNVIFVNLAPPWVLEDVPNYG